MKRLFLALALMASPLSAPSMSKAHIRAYHALKKEIDCYIRKQVKHAKNDDDDAFVNFLMQKEAIIRNLLTRINTLLNIYPDDEYVLSLIPVQNNLQMSLDYLEG